MFYCPVNTSANSPTSMPFSLLVEKHTGVKQTITVNQNNNISTWVRNRLTSSCGAWYQVWGANGHLYSWDESQNAVFPAQLKAKNFNSIASTGTAPFTVASSTVVPNLNADLLDGKHSSDFSIIEQGVNANGKYFKFSSGLLICVGTVSWTFTTAQVSTGVYGTGTTTPPLINIPFPYTFIEAPTLALSMQVGEVVGLAVRQCFTTYFNHRVYTYLNFTTAITKDLNFLAVGRWC